VATALTNAITDERGRWLLGAHPEARNEYRLRTYAQGQVRTYVIDRVFRAKDNAEWVVDYKTSRHEGADIEGFLDRERERYAPRPLSSPSSRLARALNGGSRSIAAPLGQ
jgi:hypothetical protein